MIHNVNVWWWYQFPRCVNCMAIPVYIHHSLDYHVRHTMLHRPQHEDLCNGATMHNARLEASFPRSRLNSIIKAYESTYNLIICPVHNEHGLMPYAWGRFECWMLGKVPEGPVRILREHEHIVYWCSVFDGMQIRHLAISSFNSIWFCGIEMFIFRWNSFDYCAEHRGTAAAVERCSSRCNSFMLHCFIVMTHVHYARLWHITHAQSHSPNWLVIINYMEEYLAWPRHHG